MPDSIVQSHKRRRTWLLAALFVILIAAYLIWSVVDARAARSFADAIARADQLTLYEGLPHQMFERAVLEHELKSKPTIRLHDYPFYSQPLSVSVEDAKRLREILSHRKTFESFAVEKKCGGFHPDWAIEFQSDSRRYRALLCFGCGEAKISTSSSPSRYDLQDLAKEELEKILTRYRTNRPRREEK